jgi:membrane peptidoglycan carboxypeptidase
VSATTKQNPIARAAAHTIITAMGLIRAARLVRKGRDARGDVLLDTVSKAIERLDDVRSALLGDEQAMADLDAK